MNEDGEEKKPIRLMGETLTMYNTKPKGMKGIVKIDSYEWYNMGPYQVYIPNNIGCLTMEGYDMRKQAWERAEREKPRKVVEDAMLVPVSSGTWVPDKNSVYYRKGDFIKLEHMTDFILHGYIGGEYFDTSRVVWNGETSRGDKWVITEHGNLYYYEERA